MTCSAAYTRSLHRGHRDAAPNKGGIREGGWVSTATDQPTRLSRRGAAGLGPLCLATCHARGEGDGLRRPRPGTRHAS